MKKLAIVINGAGGVGKDTLCDIASKHYKVKNISSVTPIKEIAAMCGWDGRKDAKSRKFLSDLKKLSAEYNDFPTIWALEEYHAFLESDLEILFVHIREGEEIHKFVDGTDGHARTLLIRGGTRTQTARYGNHSDDDVEDYPYDYYYTNDLSLSETDCAFCRLLERMLDELDA